MKKILIVILGLMTSPLLAQSWGSSNSSTTPVTTVRSAVNSSATPLPSMTTVVSTVSPVGTPVLTAPQVTSQSTSSATPSASTTLPKPPAFTSSSLTPTDNTSGGERFELQFNASAISGASSAAATQLGLGFGFDARISYAFDDFFSIGLESGYDANSFNNKVLGAGSFGLPSGATASITHIPALIVFQIGLGDQGGPIQPYLILGAGLALDSYSLQGAVFPPGAVTSWANFEFDPGFGMAFVLSKGMNLFVQAKADMDFDDNSDSNAEMADTPIITVPVQVGLNFSL